jgi:hypothetical protein
MTQRATLHLPPRNNPIQDAAVRELTQALGCYGRRSAEIGELEVEDSMKSVKFGTIGILVGAAALTASGGAFAQDANGQVGTTATTTTTTTVAPAPAPAPAPATAQPAPPQTGMALPGAATETVVVPAGTDHELVSGHFGVGYLGRRTVGVNVGPNNSIAPIDAPVIGMRYWLDPTIGIDAGLGLTINGGSVKADPGGTTTDLQGFTAFIVHAGVPLALAGSKHFSFQIVPELNAGFASSTQSAQAPGAADVDFSGFHLDVGARAGTEIQFGFIGIPELSLQAGVGLALNYDRVKVTTKTNPETSGTLSRTAFGTVTGDNPWNIFTGNIAALYYFD